MFHVDHQNPKEVKKTVSNTYIYLYISDDFNLLIQVFSLFSILFNLD